MLRGRVKFFDRANSHGFVIRDDGQGEVFVHASRLASSGIVDGLMPGDLVEFTIYRHTDGRERVERLTLLSRAPSVSRIGGRV